MSFYKLDNNQLLVGDVFVYGPTFTLQSTLHETYEYPVDGWYWYDTLEEAEAALNFAPVISSIYDTILTGIFTSEDQQAAKEDMAAKLSVNVVSIEQLLRNILKHI